jgi:hypothetical protein
LSYSEGVVRFSEALVKFPEKIFEIVNFQKISEFLEINFSVI